MVVTVVNAFPPNILKYSQLHFEEVSAKEQLIHFLPLDLEIVFKKIPRSASILISVWLEVII